MDTRHVTAPSESARDCELILRYSLRHSAPTLDLRARQNLMQLYVSATSVRRHLSPHVRLKVVAYSDDVLRPHLVRLFRAAALDFTVLRPDDRDAARIASELVNAPYVDRICLERMLLDRRKLDTDRYRLFIGNDCYFQSTPWELIDFVKQGVRGVAYAVDTHTWAGELYRLRYHTGKLLDGLLSDFYCLSPGVEPTREECIEAFRRVDAWPTTDQWVPVHEHLSTVPFAFEQQVAAMVLARFPSTPLDGDRYRHWEHAPDAAMVHSKRADQYVEARLTLARVRFLQGSGLFGTFISWLVYGQPRCWSFADRGVVYAATVFMKAMTRARSRWHSARARLRAGGR